MNVWYAVETKIADQLMEFLATIVRAKTERLSTTDYVRSRFITQIIFGIVCGLIGAFQGLATGDSTRAVPGGLPGIAGGLPGIARAVHLALKVKPPFYFLLVTFSLERESNQKVMRGFVVVFKGAYEIASLSPRKTRSLRAFFLAHARQKPV